MRNMHLTIEDQAVLLRALGRGMDSVNVLMPMMIDGDEADAFIMRAREEGKALDREYEAECAERDAADRADWRAMNGIC